MSSFKICVLVWVALVFTAFGCSEVLAGDCLIKIDFAKAKLVVSESGKKQKKVFTVGLPEYKFKNMPIKGRVIGIEKNPCWRPTENTKEYYRKEYEIELKDYYAPDDPGNAMGEAKILMKFEGNSVPPAVMIHGTEDLESIGQRQSLGCIRMTNEDILALVKFISGKKTEVLFE